MILYRKFKTKQKTQRNPSQSFRGGSATEQEGWSKKSAVGKVSLLLLHFFFFFLAIAHLTFLSVQWHGFKVRSGKQSLESSNLGVSCQFKHLLAEESLISCLLFLGKLFLLMSPVWKLIAALCFSSVFLCWIQKTHSSLCVFCNSCNIGLISFC